MQAVNYSNFRQNLKTHLKTINENAEPLYVTTRNAEDDVVVLSVTEYDALMETAKITANSYLMEKIKRGDAQIAKGQFQQHDLIGEHGDEEVLD